jgi:hypothetical protein
MRAFGIVVDARGFDQAAGFGKRREHVLVEALVTQLALTAAPRDALAAREAGTEKRRRQAEPRNDRRL